MQIDIRVDTSWRSHKKRWRLFDAAGNDGLQAILDLWIYAATYCPEDGILRDMTEKDIVRAAQYTGDKDIISIFCSEKFLDKIKQGKTIVYALHNWKNRQGYLCESKSRSEIARNAAKVKWEKAKSSLLGACSEHAGSTAGSNAKKISSNAPVPDPIPYPSPVPNPLPNPTPEDLNHAPASTSSTGLSTDSTRRGLQSVQDIFSRIKLRAKAKPIHELEVVHE